ncbi:MAG TPA: hypothetical protein VE053_14865 [Allosphingosinicella sp.]|nr:hypothetical protein [Allosphingosinicella sp.]
MTGRILRFSLALLAGVTLSSAARAQDDPGSLAAATRQLDSGMALARRQIGASDLPGAIGTLERVLFAYPEAAPPRLLYAALLCRLDDRQGAELELGLLAGRPIADSDWAGVASACGPVPRPGSPRRGKRR